MRNPLAAESDPIPHALALVMRILDVSDVELARRCHVSHQRIQARRTGVTAIRTVELATFAHALGVPTAVLTMSDAEILRHFADAYAARDSNPGPTDYVLVELPFPDPGPRRQLALAR